MNLWLFEITINNARSITRWFLVCFIYGLVSASSVLANDAEPDVIVTIDETNNRWHVVANMRIQLTPLAFIELLDSGLSNCDWMHNCKSIKLLAKPNNNTSHIQTRINSPWPFDDRLMITQSRIEFNGDESEVSVYINPLTPTKAQRELADTVLVKNPRGTWRLLKRDNTYQLSYVGSADLDKAIPLFIIKSSLIRSTRNTFKNIYNKVNKKVD